MFKKDRLLVMMVDAFERKTRRDFFGSLRESRLLCRRVDRWRETQKKLLAVLSLRAMRVAIYDTRSMLMDLSSRDGQSTP